MRNLFLSFFVFLFSNTSWAQTSSMTRNTLTSASLAATCATCHAPSTKSSIPSLKGLDDDYIRTSLMRFKTEQRTGTIMNQIAKGYTDEQIKMISSYLGNKN
jgi:sulfide dehydrogenase cytochrome subunit